MEQQAIGIKAIIPLTLALLRELTKVMAHRGPNESSKWKTQQSIIGLGHTRVSIKE